MKGKISEITILMLVLVIVTITMWSLSGSNFMNIGNFQSMGYQMPELGLLSMAMMVTILTAGINLSIIATANLSGIIMALILTSTPAAQNDGSTVTMIVVAAILAGVLVSFLVGILNGFLVAHLDISPILATLGTMILLSGVSIVLTKGYVISGFPDAMLQIGNGDIFGIPIPFIIFIGCAIALAVILRKTPLGKSIYLIGSNPIACYFSGINNRSVLMRTYIISGLYSGIAGIIMISRFNSAKADYGESYLLLTVLAAVLGGVNAAGGFGKVSGLILALFILQIVSSGLNLIGVSNFLTLALWGIILIIVMVIKYAIETIQQKRKLT